MKKYYSNKPAGLMVAVLLLLSIGTSTKAQLPCSNNNPCPKGYNCDNGYCTPVVHGGGGTGNGKKCNPCFPPPCRSCGIGIFFSDPDIKIVSAPGPSLAEFSFQVDDINAASIKIYDATGRLIRTLARENMHPGLHQFTWNAKDENGNSVPAGIYRLLLKAGGQTETGELLVTR